MTSASRQRRRAWAACGLALMVWALAACGGGNGEEAPPTTPLVFRMLGGEPSDVPYLADALRADGIKPLAARCYLGEDEGCPRDGACPNDDSPGTGTLRVFVVVDVLTSQVPLAQSWAPGSLDGRSELSLGTPVECSLSK